MGKYRNLTSIIITILIFSFIFSLGSVNFAQNPVENKKEFNKEERLNKALEGLVEKGLLKQEDIKKIRDYLKVEREEKRKMFEQMKKMTEDERKEFLKNYRKNKVDVWDKMVKDKVITQEQAEEIRKVMPRFKQKDCKDNKQ